MPADLPTCAPMESPIGRLWVSVSARGLVALSRGDLPPAGCGLDPGPAAAIVGQLQAYFAGRLRHFDVRLDLTRATAFDAAVWRATMAIPYGETASYGELAAMAGYPGAARAAGGSMSRCPLFPVVPCHRVIHADGSIGGWGPDLWIKRLLLDLEAGGSRGEAGLTDAGRRAAPSDRRESRHG